MYVVCWQNTKYYVCTHKHRVYFSLKTKSISKNVMYLKKFTKSEKLGHSF